jgi:hypothetical protein
MVKGKNSLTWPGRNPQYPGRSPFEEDDYPEPREDEEDEDEDEEDDEDEAG